MKQSRLKLSYILYGVIILLIVIIPTDPKSKRVVRATAPRKTNSNDEPESSKIRPFSQLLGTTQNDGKRKQPIYKLDEYRFLVLVPGGNGLNNQLQCINLAANLAIEYNRTLLVGPNAYTGSYHSRDTIPFGELFDVPNAKLSIKIVDTLPNPNVRITSFDPEKPFRKELMIDPNPDEQYVAFPCLCGELHHSLPPGSHRDELLLPFHPIYHNLAVQVLEEIEHRVHMASYQKDFHLLGMHVRRGDLKGYPVFECSETAFPYLSTFKEGGWWLAACTTVKDDNGSHNRPDESELLSWDRVFQQLHNCDPGIPLCAKDYDAIFVATNDVTYVRAWGTSNLFVLDDFPFVKDTFCETRCHTIKEFVVEEMVLAASATFQPSIPSSITDMILHLRLDMQTGNERDIHTYQTYDRIGLELKNLRKGNIFNWETLAKAQADAKSKSSAG